MSCISQPEAEVGFVVIVAFAGHGLGCECEEAEEGDGVPAGFQC